MTDTAIRNILLKNLSQQKNDNGIIFISKEIDPLSIGIAISAVCNSARKSNIQKAYIFFGVEKCSGSEIGKPINSTIKDLNNKVLLNYLIENTFPHITIRYIEIFYSNKKIPTFEIQVPTMETFFKGESYLCSDDKIKIAEEKKKLIITRTQKHKDIESEKQLLSTKAEKQYIIELIYKYLKDKKQASKKDIYDLILKNISDDRSDKQRETKIKNLMAEMTRNQIIRNIGIKSKPLYQLVNPTKDTQ